MSRGYLTMAARKTGFLEMAVDMALSLREHTEYPIALAADEQLTAQARARYADVFDEVRPIPGRFMEGRALKYGSAEASPFEETIFVDADCLVLAGMDDLWSALDTADMAMVGEHLTADEDRRHHGFSTSTLIRQFGLETYLKTNSGLFCFRRSAAIDLMEACRECYLTELRPRYRWSTVLGRWLGDEIAFGIVGGRRGIAALPKPDKMYWPEEFEALDLADPSKPLLHMIWPPRADTLEQLLESTGRRRRAAGVPGDAEPHWRAEVRRLERLAGRRRILDRVGLG